MTVIVPYSSWPDSSAVWGPMHVNTVGRQGRQDVEWLLAIAVHAIRHQASGLCQGSEKSFACLVQSDGNICMTDALEIISMKYNLDQ
jgi:hypothetical protein